MISKVASTASGGGGFEQVQAVKDGAGDGFFGQGHGRGSLYQL